MMDGFGERGQLGDLIAIIDLVKSSQIRFVIICDILLFVKHFDSDQLWRGERHMRD